MSFGRFLLQDNTSIPLLPPSPLAPPPPCLIDCPTITTDNSVVASIIAGGLLGLFSLLVFSCLWRYVRVYTARLTLDRVTFKPPRTPDDKRWWTFEHLWGWLRPIFTTSKRGVLACAGLDAVIMLKILELGVQLFVPWTIVSFVVLLPIHGTGKALNEASDRSVGFSDSPSRFALLTVGNVPPEDSLLWVHFVCCYVFVLYGLWLLYFHYKGYAALADEYLAIGENHGLAVAALNREQKQRSVLAEIDGGGDAPLSLVAADDMRPPPCDPAGADGALLASAAAVPGYGARSGIGRRASTASTASADVSIDVRTPPGRMQSAATTLDSQTQDAGQRRRRRSVLARIHGAYRTFKNYLVNPLGLEGPPDEVDGSAHPGPAAFDDVLRMGGQHARASPPPRGGSPRSPTAWNHASEGVDAASTTDSLGRPNGSVAASQAAAERKPSAFAFDRRSETPFAEQPVPPNASAPPPAVIQISDDSYEPPLPAARSIPASNTPPAADSDSSVALRGDPSPETRNGAAGGQGAVDAESRAPRTRHTRDAAVQRVLAAMQSKGRGGAALQGRTRSRDTRLPQWWVRPLPADASLPTVADDRKNGIWYDPASEICRLPSVRHRKICDVLTDSSDAQTRDTVPIMAEHYCVLVTDVPTEQQDAEAERRRWASRRETATAAAATPGAASRWETVRGAIALGGGAALASGDARWERARESRRLRGKFRELFPASRPLVVPVLNFKSVHVLLLRWDAACARLERAELVYQQRLKRAEAAAAKRPTHRVGWCGCCGARVDSIVYWRAEIARLEIEIRAEQARVVAVSPSEAYFVFFQSAADATIAAQMVLDSASAPAMKVFKAPGPDDVNWPSLWKSKAERRWREPVAIILFIAVAGIPIGLVAGALTEVRLALCALRHVNEANNSATLQRICSPGGRLLQGVLQLSSAILVILWQNAVMPVALHAIGQIKARFYSLSALECHIMRLFFFWNVFNIFLGAVVSSSLSSLASMIKNPSEIGNILGLSVPSSSNFFVDYLALRALGLVLWRLVLPHGGIWRWLFTLGGHLRVMTPREEAATWAPASIRYGREVGVMTLVFVIAWAYAVVSPLVVAFAAFYFGASWVVWKYQILFICVRSYEGGGKLWRVTVQCTIWCMQIFVLFTLCVFTAKRAYWQAAILLTTLPVVIWQYGKYLKKRFGPALKYVPLRHAKRQPEVDLTPAVAETLEVMYTPAPLRPACDGWHPEWGKAWEGWGMAPYTWFDAALPGGASGARSKSEHPAGELPSGRDAP